MYDVVVVGGGAAAASVMLGLIERGVKPLLVDVGYAPDPAGPTKGGQNLYRLRQQSDAFGTMIGERYQGLHNVLSGDKRPPKLVAPEMEYVMRDSGRLSPRVEEGFSPFISFARGGLGAAWGCGLFRSVDRDLAGLPITLDDLDPFFDRLTEEIGICGGDDALTPFFGSPRGLQPPLKLSKKAAALLRRFERKRHSLERQGVYAGLPRLGVLTHEKDGREPVHYDNLEMWRAENPSLYNPYYTIARAVDKGQVEYQSGWFVRAYRTYEDRVEIDAIGEDGMTKRCISARTLVLAAGAINTAQLVLRSHGDTHTRLPIFDNPLFQVPLVLPDYIGTELETDCFAMTQLNFVFDLKELGLLLQGSVIELTSPPRAALVEMFPFSIKGNLALARFLAPAAMVLFLYFPIAAEQGGTLDWDGNRLQLKGSEFSYPKTAIGKVVRALLRLGVMTAPTLIQRAQNGYAVHYAGTLPMQKVPTGEYQCDTEGRLGSGKRVYVADGSLFSKLPAKNSSFMMMANAMRIGEALGRRGG